METTSTGTNACVITSHIHGRPGASSLTWPFNCLVSSFFFLRVLFAVICWTKGRKERKKQKRFGQFLFGACRKRRRGRLRPTPDRLVRKDKSAFSPQRKDVLRRKGSNLFFFFRLLRLPFRSVARRRIITRAFDYKATLSFRNRRRLFCSIYSCAPPPKSFLRSTFFSQKSAQFALFFLMGLAPFCRLVLFRGPVLVSFAPCTKTRREWFPHQRKVLLLSPLLKKGASSSR